MQGISFGQRSEPENLAKRFAPVAGPGVQVGVLHCNVQGAATGYDDYSPCTLEDLQHIGLDYWALGHVHTRMILSGRKDADEPWVVYPGNLQARSPKPSERGPKGAMVVHVRGGRIAGVEPVACDVVRFDLVPLEIAGIADLAVLRSRLVDAARERLASADGRSLVLRGQLLGQGEIHRDLRRPGALPDLLVALREDFSGDDPFCWWDSIDDQSRPLIDIAVARAGADFAADLIVLADELTRKLTSEDQALSELADALSEGLPGPLRQQRAVERLLESSSVPVSDFVDRALVLALGELDGDER